MPWRPNPVYNCAYRNKGREIIVQRRRVIILGSLAVWYAMAGLGFAQETGPVPKPVVAAEKPGGLGEMREWLSRRNQERKKLGLPGADMTKTHVASIHPHLQPWAKEAGPSRKAGENGRNRPTPVPETGRGPDGRIHHRLVLNEEGPDQLQVYTPSGYGTPLSAEGTAKLERLTVRGKRAWISGSSLRDPDAYWAVKRAEQDGGDKAP